MFGRRTLPLPLDLQWPMKAWEDAKLELRYERAHMIMTIEHELVRGVTPAMLDWWFRHIGGEVEINGRTYSRYRVWHPLDHIDWQLVEGDPAHVGVGAKFRIIEAFSRNPAWLVDQRRDRDEAGRDRDPAGASHLGIRGLQPRALVRAG